MQPINTYQNEAYLRVLVQGPSGCGKTTMASQFPGTYIADCDMNLAGPLRFLSEANLPLPVGYDIIDRTEEGKVVGPGERFTRLSKCIHTAAQLPEVKTIVIDSASKLQDYLVDEILRQQGAKVMTIQHWGFLMKAWKELISQLSTYRKHLVLIAHEEVEKDEVDQQLKYFLAIQGKTRYFIASLFTDVWRCEVETTGGLKPKYTWQIRTMPDRRYALKNSLGLSATFEFNWETIQARLDYAKASK